MIDEFSNDESAVVILFQINYACVINHHDQLIKSFQILVFRKTHNSASTVQKISRANSRPQRQMKLF